MSSRLSPLSKASNGLASDFRALAGHAEDLLKATADITTGKVKSAREQLDASLSEAHSRLESAQDQSLEVAKAAVTRSVEYARERPYQTAAIATLLGLAIAGLWYSRSKQ
ncbi:MAG: DUF883 family protein [Pseudomonadota bacterium]|nr:DUF883 family protein [Pseudomonadota bacterium]